MAEELRILQAQADLAEGRFVRKDGRDFNSHRPLEVTLDPIKTADGSCLVRFGNTCVLCGLRAEIAEKQLGDPFQDINISVQAQLPFKNIGASGPSEEEQALSQRLQDILLSCSAFPSRRISERFSWLLHVTITCLDSDGNLLGASLAAISGALSCLKLPAARHDEEEDTLVVGNNYEKVALVELPIGVTFGIINKSLVVDMTHEEQLLARGESCVVLDSKGEVVHLAKLGGVPMPATEIATMLSKALEHAKEIRNVLK
ncbi:exosome complex component RRP43-like [Varroa jacobsoni]|nr:exosome complex component RRP43-like isoform X2 [Varroa destructor]XP_022663172.1 exosome complex component RRP43-like isoform X2 [Varroa destructor]XP_022663173.1 exosome complex component RRP43-like isoform X2 [Varroa destructor]XP_022710246.1 exosome complex component RRP43-like [Varroa jacobsoni]XP_022710248.1 exosome complex component RRP43-like [Varroa jacobsoni]XP_022710249.1 exosome complex component RRP43-like [Varroa jacobsoni]